jgi:hypothetical protein
MSTLLLTCPVCCMNDVTIQMPAAQRFGFMHKYSADEYSMEMGRAVDMWAECAVLVLCVAEVNKLLSKLKVGCTVRGYAVLQRCSACGCC